MKGNVCQKVAFISKVTTEIRTKGHIPVHPLFRGSTVTFKPNLNF